MEDEEKKIRTVVELSVQPQALAPLLVRVLAHKNSAYSSRSVTYPFLFLSTDLN